MRRDRGLSGVVGARAVKKGRHSNTRSRHSERRVSASPRRTERPAAPSGVELPAVAESNQPCYPYRTCTSTGDRWDTLRVAATAKAF
jgi:hypothetical protein